MIIFIQQKQNGFLVDTGFESLILIFSLNFMVIFLWMITDVVWYLSIIKITQTVQVKEFLFFRVFSLVLFCKNCISFLQSFSLNFDHFSWLYFDCYWLNKIIFFISLIEKEQELFLHCTFFHDKLVFSLVKSPLFAKMILLLWRHFKFLKCLESYLFVIWGC